MVEKGDAEELKRLLKKRGARRRRVNPNSVSDDEFGWTPLMIAAYRGHSRLIQPLLEAKASVYLKSQFKDDKDCSALL